MTKLEKYLMARNWDWIDNAFTAVHKGFGFVIFSRGTQMWVAGLTKETVAYCFADHNIKLSIESGQLQHPTTFIFPASIEIISAAVASAFPELRL